MNLSMDDDATDVEIAAVHLSAEKKQNGRDGQSKDFPESHAHCNPSKRVRNGNSKSSSVHDTFENKLPEKEQLKHQLKKKDRGSSFGVTFMENSCVSQTSEQCDIQMEYYDGMETLDAGNLKHSATVSRLCGSSMDTPNSITGSPDRLIIDESSTTLRSPASVASGPPTPRSARPPGSGIRIQPVKLVMPTTDCALRGPAVLLSQVKLSENVSLSELSTVVSKSSSVMATPSFVVGNPSSVVSKTSAVVSKPSFVVPKPSSGVEKSSSVVSNPSPVVAQHFSVMSKPSCVVAKRSSVVTKPFSVVVNSSSVVSKPSSVVFKPASVVANPSSIVSESPQTAQPGTSTDSPFSASLRRGFRTKRKIRVRAGRLHRSRPGVCVRALYKRPAVRSTSDRRLSPEPADGAARDANWEDPPADGEPPAEATDATESDALDGWGSDTPTDINEEDMKKFDRDIRGKATRNKLNVRMVKTMIKHIINNEQVQAMMEHALAKEQDPEAAADSVYEPTKMTRSRAKQLLVESHLAEVPITPVKSASEQTKQLVSHDFPEDDDDHDEEYTPRRAPSCASSPTSRGSSPTPSSPCSTLMAPCTPRTPGSTVEEPPSKRTRSRLPLVDQPLESLEQMLVAPDVTPDMYNPTIEGDEDWATFLRDFNMPLQTCTESQEDEEEDEEYVFRLDEDEDEREERREELRSDPAVRITKKEVNKLMMELFKDVNDLQHEPEPYGMQMESLTPPPIPCGLERSDTAPLETGQWTAPPPSGMTARQAQQLQYQMTVHVQQLVTTYVTAAEQQWLQAERTGAAALLVELNTLSSSLKADRPAESFFQPANLAPALEIVAEWDQIPPQQLIGEFSSTVYRWSEKRRNRYCKFSRRLVDTVLNSTAFVFPALLPLSPPVFEPHPSWRLASPSIDQLIAMGLEQFTPYAHAFLKSGVPTGKAVIRLIEEHMLTPLTVRWLRHRINTIRKRNMKDNPICIYLDTFHAPVVNRRAECPEYPLVPISQRNKRTVPLPWRTLARKPNREYYFSCGGDDCGQQVKKSLLRRKAHGYSGRWSSKPSSSIDTVTAKESPQCDEGEALPARRTTTFDQSPSVFSVLRDVGDGGPYTRPAPADSDTDSDELSDPDGLDTPGDPEDTPLCPEENTPRIKQATSLQSMTMARHKERKKQQSWVNTLAESIAAVCGVPKRRRLIDESVRDASGGRTVMLKSPNTDSAIDGEESNADVGRNENRVSAEKEPENQKSSRRRPRETKSNRIKTIPIRPSSAGAIPTKSNKLEGSHNAKEKRGQSKSSMVTITKVPTETGKLLKSMQRELSRCTSSNRTGPEAVGDAVKNVEDDVVELLNSVESSPSKNTRSWVRKRATVEKGVLEQSRPSLIETPVEEADLDVEFKDVSDDGVLVLTAEEMESRVAEAIDRVLSSVQDEDEVELTCGRERSPSKEKDILALCMSEVFKTQKSSESVSDPDNQMQHPLCKCIVSHARYDEEWAEVYQSPAASSAQIDPAGSQASTPAKNTSSAVKEKAANAVQECVLGVSEAALPGDSNRMEHSDCVEAGDHNTRAVVSEQAAEDVHVEETIAINLAVPPAQNGNSEREDTNEKPILGDSVSIDEAEHEEIDVVTVDGEEPGVDIGNELPINNSKIHDGRACESVLKSADVTPKKLSIEDQELSMENQEVETPRIPQTVDDEVAEFHKDNSNLDTSTIELKEEAGEVVIYVRSSTPGRVPVRRVPVGCNMARTRLLLPPSIMLQDINGSRPSTPRLTGIVNPTVRSTTPDGSAEAESSTASEHGYHLRVLEDRSTEEPAAPPAESEPRDEDVATQEAVVVIERSVSPPPRAQPPPSSNSQDTCSVDGPFKLPFTPHKPTRRVTFPPASSAITVYPVTTHTTGQGGERASSTSGGENGAPGQNERNEATAPGPADTIMDDASRSMSLPELPVSSAQSPPRSSAERGLELQAMVPLTLMTPRRCSSPPQPLCFGFPTPSANTPALTGPSLSDLHATPLPPRTPQPNTLETPLMQHSPPVNPMLETPLVNRSPPRESRSPPPTGDGSGGEAMRGAALKMRFFSDVSNDHPPLSSMEESAALKKPAPETMSEQSLGGILDMLLTRPSGSGDRKNTDETVARESSRGPAPPVLVAESSQSAMFSTEILTGADPAKQAQSTYASASAKDKAVENADPGPSQPSTSAVTRATKTTATTRVRTRSESSGSGPTLRRLSVGSNSGTGGKADTEVKATSKVDAEPTPAPGSSEHQVEDRTQSSTATTSTTTATATVTVSASLQMPAPTKCTRPPKRTRQQREAELTQLALGPEEEEVRARWNLDVAANFYQRLKECTESIDPVIYEKVSRLLSDLEPASSVAAQLALFDSTRHLLRGFPDLLDQLLGMLDPAVAVERGCVVKHVRAARTTEFARRVENIHGSHPMQIQKVSRALTQLASRSEDGVSAGELRAAALPLTRPCPLLGSHLNSLLDSEPPPAELMRTDDDFETSVIDEEDEDDDGFEVATDLTAGFPDPYGTDQCECQCHTERVDDARYLQRRRHCERCGLKFIGGRAYLQTGKVLRPARIISCRSPSPPDPALPTPHANPDPCRSPPAKRPRKKSTTKAEKAPKKEKTGAAASGGVSAGKAAVAPTKKETAQGGKSAASEKKNGASSVSGSQVSRQAGSGTPQPSTSKQNISAACSPASRPGGGATTLSPSRASTSTARAGAPSPVQPAVWEEPVWSREEDLEILTSCQRYGDGEKTFRTIQRRLPRRSLDQLQHRFQHLIAMLRQQLRDAGEEV